MKYTSTLLLLFIIVCFAPQKVAAQRFAPITITGKITSTDNTPLEFATVAAYSLKDSSLVSGGISETDGSFSIKSKSRKVYLEIEYIGFEKKVISDLAIEKGKTTYDLGGIVLSQGGIALDAIEVKAERSELQFSLDKRVFNVGKDLSSSGGSAQDILTNIPSVSVGVEGEVELRGSSNVRILINGRPSGLVGIGSTGGLRNIQASMIERVEIITNPSSKYEAEGMAGIINIVLKKERRRGFNGAFELSGGYPTQYGLGANINYRQDNFNFFINGNIGKRTGPAVGNKYQEFSTAAGTNISVINSRRDRNSEYYSFQGGSDYYLSDKEVITAAFLYKYDRSLNDNYVNYRDTLMQTLPSARLTASDFDQYTRRTDDEIEREPTLEFSVNYDKKFNKKGHKLKATVSYQDSEESESSDLKERLFRYDVATDEKIFNQKSANVEGQGQWRVQMDYTQPFDDKSKVETGVLGNFRTIDNDYKVETLIDGVYTIDPNLTNNFIYKENIAAAYANYGKEYKRFSYQVGLRGETSFISTNLLTTNEVNDRTYTNLFPSAFAGYKFEGNNSIQASYSRRIRRPRFWDLNPFFTLTDRRNFFSGNPNLDPEYTNSYELSYLKQWESANIGTSIYYRRTTDLITRIVTRIEGTENETLRRPENIGIENNYGLEFVWGYTGIKWLRLDGSVNGFRFDVSGQSTDGTDLSADAYTWEGKLNSRVSFWKNANLQLRLNYRAPRKSVQGERKSITAVNIAAAKDFLDNNLTVTLSVRDLFNNRRRRSIAYSDNYFEENDFQWRPRTFTATLNYRLNRKKSRGRRTGGYQGGGGF